MEFKVWKCYFLCHIAFANLGSSFVSWKFDNDILYAQMKLPQFRCRYQVAVIGDGVSVHCKILFVDFCFVMLEIVYWRDNFSIEYQYVYLMYFNLCERKKLKWREKKLDVFATFFLIHSLGCDWKLLWSKYVNSTYCTWLSFSRHENSVFVPQRSVCQMCVEGGFAVVWNNCAMKVILGASPIS